MIDRMKYRIYNWLWTLWHMRAREYFDSFTPPSPYAKYITTSRPWWHLCCNGDCGGWRTAVCDHLEHGWRYTKHYMEDR